LDAKSIERVVRKDRPWERCLANSPDPPAKIAVRFVIEPSGRVSDVRDAGSIRVDAAAMKCILSAFSGLTFPQHQGGPITLVFPVTF